MHIIMKKRNVSLKIGNVSGKPAFSGAPPWRAARSRSPLRRRVRESTNSSRQEEAESLLEQLVQASVKAGHYVVEAAQDPPGSAFTWPNCCQTQRSTASSSKQCTCSDWCQTWPSDWRQTSRPEVAASKRNAPLSSPCTRPVAEMPAPKHQHPLSGSGPVPPKDPPPVVAKHPWSSPPARPVVPKEPPHPPTDGASESSTAPLTCPRTGLPMPPTPPPGGRWKIAGAPPWNPSI